MTRLILAETAVYSIAAPLNISFIALCFSIQFQVRVRGRGRSKVTTDSREAPPDAALTIHLGCNYFWTKLTLIIKLTALRVMQALHTL